MNYTVQYFHIMNEAQRVFIYLFAHLLEHIANSINIASTLTS